METLVYEGKHRDCSWVIGVCHALNSTLPSYYDKDGKVREDHLKTDYTTNFFGKIKTVYICGSSDRISAVRSAINVVKARNS